MDPELRTLLKALLDGQVNLAEGLTSLTKRVEQLAEGQVKLAEGQVKLAEGQVKLADGLASLTTRVDARFDRLTEQMTRGFTDAASHRGSQEERFERIEARVAKLKPPGRSVETTPRR